MVERMRKLSREEVLGIVRLTREENKRLDPGLVALHWVHFERPDLRGVDLRGVDLRGVDLRMADLRMADLRGANLSEANLSSAALRNAHLHGANLTRANLGEADLNGANLTRANLGEADLNGANLSKANLSRVDLSGANLTRANLGGADLNGANLSRADLSGANLSEAALSVATLSQAHLNGSNLTEAYLRNAHLHGANLSGANLTKANLGGVDLSEANLSNVDLSGANFRDAKVGWTVFGSTDLSVVEGLDRVIHNGPSYIDIHTLFHSKGHIPEVFLRGAGLPDISITDLPSMLGQAIQYYSCFISYASEDTAFAERLHADLQQKGVRCWFAPEDLKIGAKIRPSIDESIRLHDKLLLILSEHSLASNWVEHEVEAALEQERQRKETVLFPIRVDEAVMRSEVGWAALIKRTRHIGDFREWEGHEPYQKAFQRLLKDLKVDEKR